MLADDVSFVVGVDTHVDGHALALVEVKSQRTRRELTIRATRSGYRQALLLCAGMLPVAASGRWKARAATAPGSRAFFPSEASVCSRSSGPHAAARRRA